MIPANLRIVLGIGCGLFAGYLCWLERREQRP